MRTGVSLSLLAGLAALLGPVALAAGEARASRPADAVMAALAAYVAEQTGYPPLRAAPELRVVDAATLGTAVGSAGDHGEGKPWAAYSRERHEILLHEQADLDSVAGRGYLVHELVHAHQFAADAHRDVPCTGALEGEAYRVQARYLRGHGAGDEAFTIRLLGLLWRACGQFYRE